MIDLHTHSTASDGTCSPAGLVKIASELGITHLALTDHDTTDGLEEFLSSTAEIRLIPGIELSVDYPVGELHLVGLFIDKDAPDMAALVKEVKGYRAERNGKMLEKLSALVKRKVMISDLTDNPEGQLGRPHMAKYLVKNGIVSTLQEAFSEYLADGRILSVPKRRISMDRAFGVIKAVGGVAVLAHPSTLGLGDHDLDELVKSCKAKGLDALEVFSSHSPDEKKEVYSEIARRNGLAVSCGSDFHGGNSKVARPGAELGNMKDGEILEPLYKIALSRGWKEPI